MVRKADSGWRDLLLDNRHSYYGYDFPASGMALPMIEYDRGNAVGLISYHRRGVVLPKGSDAVRAHEAFSHVHAEHDGSQLPFLTVVYDADRWAFKVFPHNEAARLLVGKGWTDMTEREFVTVLYGLRNRPLPDLSWAGVAWNTLGWDSSFPGDWGRGEPNERWPGEAMSVRRRNYEPTVQLPFKQRIPCLDIDFAVVDVDGRLSLVVDYKRIGTARTTYPDAAHDFNAKALSSLRYKHLANTFEVAAIVAEYAPVKPGWDYRIHMLNPAARSLLSYTLGSTGAGTKQLAEAIAGDGWLAVDETQWRDVLACARDMV